MNILYTVMAVFTVLGALDLIIGNRFGIGAEFQRGLFMLGELTLSMVGMMILSPLFAHLLSAPLQQFYRVIPIDPSSFVGCLFACDMGGADLAGRIALDGTIGRFSGLIVGSMMGATVSFTLPFVMGVTEKRQRDSILLGLICGISTVPVGCLVAGLLCGIPVRLLLLNMIPLALIAALCVVGLIFLREVSLKIFNGIGGLIRALVISGLAVGIVEYTTGLDILPHTASLADGIAIVLDIVVIMVGAFPLIYVLTKLLKRPLAHLSRRTGLHENSLVGFVSTLATSVTTFGMMRDMDDRGVCLNSAFAVSAAFVFVDHLAYTAAYDASYLLPMIVGKLISGVSAVLVALLLTKKAEPRR